MNIIRTSFLGVAFGIILVACDGDFAIGPGLEDFSTPLAGNYNISRTSAHQIVIVPNSGWTPDTPIIPTKVVECDSDGQFIIAKRQGLKRRNPDNPQDNYEEPDPDAFDYWILDTRKPAVFGPLTEEAFDKMRKDLEVPESLSLRDVYDYRPKETEQGAAANP